MSRVDVVILGAVIVVMGCASAQKEEPQPASSPRLSRSSRPTPPPPRTYPISLDARAPATELGQALAERAREIGVSGQVAFVWGDVVPAPPNARRVELRAGSASVPGFLVPEAHEIDMGQLAPDIHNVVMVGCDEQGLYGSHPSGPGRHRIDFSVSDAETRREAHEVFAFVSIMPGDVSSRLTSGQVVSLLGQLPTRVRYAVLALPS
ncbi:MAG: hypothetical protein IPM35_06405 [Myxococcales bacterium]|nr:hypothetical protein [Myxococcales bacterium]